ncbi:MAG: family 10 glycosylhydrolase [Bacteroidota bacterium]
MRVLCAALLATLFASSPLAQTDLPPKEEFRGAWIATVINLDWPSSPGLPVATMKAQLVEILDGMQSAGLNAALFQVRTEADALYASDIEPWSYWLTGAQGTAPPDSFDPLAFAIEEAHKRGLELHAWLNPYRASRGNTYPKAASHVTQTNPEWLLDFSSGSSPITIFDPGLQVSRDRVATIVADIARRYDIDGIHFDDYFYPYPPNAIGNEDQATFDADPRGFTDIGDWRRENVDLMVAQVQDSLLTVRPDAAFGISPFGIWKNSVPPGIRGLDAYNVIYSDPLAWLEEGTIDYITPQLYWSSQRSLDTNGDGTPDTFNNQRFTTLASWWNGQRNGRHFYPGLAPYRIGQPGYDNTEIPTQIRYTRSLDGGQGTVMFRVNAGLLKFNQGLADSLATDLYRQPALTPSMAWKSQDAPGVPTGLAATHTSGEGAVSLAWAAPAGGDADARFYAVYRVPQAEAGDLASAMADSRYLALVTGETTAIDNSDQSGDFAYVVTAVSPNSIESSPSNTAQVQNVISTDGPADALALALRLEPASPNPFRGQTRVSFSIPEPGTVTLRVVDLLGREVARLLDDAPRASGPQSLSWSPSASIRSGTYILVLDTETERQTRSVVYIR